AGDDGGVVVVRWRDEYRKGKGEREHRDNLTRSLMVILRLWYYAGGGGAAEVERLGGGAMAGDAFVICEYTVTSVFLLHFISDFFALHWDWIELFAGQDDRQRPVKKKNKKLQSSKSNKDNISFASIGRALLFCNKEEYKARDQIQIHRSGARETKGGCSLLLEVLSSNILRGVFKLVLFFPEGYPMASPNIWDVLGVYVFMNEGMEAKPMDSVLNCNVILIYVGTTSPELQPCAEFILAFFIILQAKSFFRSPAYNCKPVSQFTFHSRCGL
ncbi:LOW QUALITY PROTEIN: hypothetical protein M8C21_023704, partial [Ambrosia artemisiifolia]